MDSKSVITSKDCLHLVNDIIVERNLLIPRLTSIKDIDYSIFQMIIEDIFCVNFFQLMPNKPKNKTQEIVFMTKILSHISDELFCISLDHIKAEDIVDKNMVSIYNLLEIISTFIKYIPKTFSKNKKTSNETKSDVKCIQTNGISTEELKFKDLFRAFDELKSKRQKRMSSSESSSSSTQPSPSQSIDSIRSLRRRSLRQLNSCIDSDKSNRKQEIEKVSKSIQTDFDTEMTPKTEKTRVCAQKTETPKEISFEEYKRLKCENFATLLGHKLHETLKLKEMSDIIENKIKRYYGDVTTKTPQRISSKLRTSRKQSFRQKKSPKIRKTPIKSKSNLKISFGTSSLEDLIKTFPEIPKNTVKTLKEQEKHQKKVIENLNKEVSVNQMKVKSKLKDAIEAQEKRSQIIRNEIKQMQSLAETKGQKMVKIKENAAKRDSRIERARIQKMIEKYQNDMNSKYKRLQSIEEQIVLKEFDKREKQRKESINDFRKRIKESHSQELEKQKKILESFETLYQHKYQMLAENLSEEENRLKNEISSQTHYLRSIKREFNERFDRDFGNAFKS